MMHIFPRLLLNPPDAASWQDEAAAHRRLQGEVAHQALALLLPGETSAGPIGRRLRQARALLGVHPRQVAIEPLIESIEQTLARPEITPLFAGNVRAFTELEIVIPADDPAKAHQLKRADRLALLPDGTAWVLDFKLGPGDPAKDRAQLRTYQRLLAAILGQNCHGAVVNLQSSDIAVLPVIEPPLDHGQGSSTLRTAGFTRSKPGPGPQDTAEPDTAEPDTAEPDTVGQDTVGPDTARPDAGEHPIKIFPLRADLLDRLAQSLLACTQAANPLDMAGMQVIFPHRRPRIHLHQHLALYIQAPFLPPRCLSLEDWILRQACLSMDDPPIIASILDQAWLLHDIQGRLDNDGQNHADGIAGPTRSGPNSSWHRFLPWGMRLAQVLDELDREEVAARNLIHPPDDLPDTALALLSNLAEVRAAFDEQLRRQGLTTPARLARQISPERLDAANHRMFLCGLFAMTASEARLVRTLRRNGARLWWQSDAPLARQLHHWAHAWQADLEWMDDVRDAHDQGITEPSPDLESIDRDKVDFVLAHDLHSELRHMAENAKTWGPEEQVAVILPNPSLLRPLLAHLPRKAEVNITLGLPLENSALGGLLTTLARMARDVQVTGVGPNSSDYLDIWQNPWVRGLLPAGGLGWLRRSIQEAMKTFLDARDMALLCQEAARRDEEDSRLQMQHRADGPPQKSRLADLIALFEKAMHLSTLGQLCAYLRELLHGLRVAEKSPSALELHAVHALHGSILPRLEQALSRNEPLPCAALWSVFQNFLRLERVPFSGEPLTPWQVMGLLESRLMCFDRVVVLECVEGILPAAGTPNPLLPEALRPALGLPPTHGEEQIIHYHLQRLMASAARVTLHGRQGLSPNPLEGRAIPSRYWEQELWRMEKHASRLLPERITQVRLDLDMGLDAPPLPDKQSLLELLTRRLDKGLSLSALNTYLSCPLRFFQDHVARFERRANAYDPAAAAMGEAAHEVLELLFQPHLGKSVVPSHLLPGFEEAWTKCVPPRLEELRLAPAARFFHIRLLRQLLLNYLRESKEPVFPVAVEEARERALPGRASAIKLKGRLDRVDKCMLTDLPLILDYKTGAAPLDRPLPVQALRELAAEVDQAELDQAGLVRIKEGLRDLQLPAYLYLYEQPGLCGFVQLGEWDVGKNFISLHQKGKKGQEEQTRLEFLDWQTSGLPLILEYIGRHILEAEWFYPACQAQICVWCPWRQTCPWALED